MQVIGKFSIRIVPNMTPEKVDKLVITYLNDLWSKRNSPNHFKLVCHIIGFVSWFSVVLAKRPYTLNSAHTLITVACLGSPISRTLASRLVPVL